LGHWIVLRPFSTQQTSGGTVLSTNWNEVAKRDYEAEVKAEATGKGKKRSGGGDEDD
jgi:hypothetical protein